MGTRCVEFPRISYHDKACFPWVDDKQVMHGCFPDKVRKNWLLGPMPFTSNFGFVWLESNLTRFCFFIFFSFALTFRCWWVRDWGTLVQRGDWFWSMHQPRRIVLLWLHQWLRNDAWEIWMPRYANWYSNSRNFHITYFHVFNFHCNLLFILSGGRKNSLL